MSQKTQTATEPETVVPAPNPEEGGGGTVENLIQRMQVKREEVKPPQFLDDLDFVDSGAQAAGEEPTLDEPLTDDDTGNLEYLNYSDEHRTSATFLIMTFDRVMDVCAGWIAGEPQADFRKFQRKADISPDYLDVTAAIVKKYQTRMSLEMILFFTVLAIYAPTFTVAFTRRKMKSTRSRQVMPDEQEQKT